MNIGPKIPAAPRERFENAPLRAMLGQVRFPRLASVSPSGPLSPYHDRVRDEFPIFAEEQQLAVTMTPGQAPEAQAALAYRFSTEGGEWSAVLGADSFTLEAGGGSRYTSYEEFMRLFEYLWEPFVEHFHPIRVTRQGLRYVDHIEGERTPGEWGAMVNPELLGPLLGTALSQGVTRAVSEIQFARSDGVLIFRHGISTAGPEDAMGYLLDFDYFTTDEVGTGSDLLRPRFDRFHDILYNFFYWSITESAREEFHNARG